MPTLKYNNNLSALAFLSCCITACSNPEPSHFSDASAHLPVNGDQLAQLETHSGWQLIWQDEFNNDVLDSENWETVVNCWGGGNNEKQCYVDNKENLFLKNGLLHIVARRQNHTGPAVRQQDPDYGKEQNTLPYTSARIRTRGKHSWRYGRFEIRAKLPAGQGTWPAIWMLPESNEYGNWAASGEIDIMEAVNLGTLSDLKGAEPTAKENRIHGTLHYGRVFPKNVYSGTGYILPEQTNPSSDFHTYALEWQEDEIRWYVDNRHFATQRSEGWFSENAEGQRQPGAAPFNQPFHLLINLAVGGAWPENVNEKGVDESVFPQQLLVDYVRVYQCRPSGQLSPNGDGCQTLDEEQKGLAAKQVPGSQ